MLGIFDVVTELLQGLYCLTTQLPNKNLSQAMQSHLSYGGMCGTGLQSYTATVLNAAESVKKGLSIVGM